MDRLPSGVVTFLFTDIEGSTRLHRQLGEKYAALLAEHDALLGRVIGEHGGVLVSSSGDGMFVAFGSAADALTCCGEAQRAIAAYPWPHGMPLRVRMGLHTGPAEPHGTGYTALAVHQAARISAIAHGGQVVVSTDTWGAAVPAPDQLTVRELGAYRLKDFDEPVHLLQLCGDRMPGEFGALRAVPAVAHNVPDHLTSFIGRRAELSALQLAVAAHRLVTVVGPGGVGKTRLCFHVAAACSATLPDGAWVIQLEQVDSLAAAESALLDGMGADPQPGRDSMAVLADHIGHRDLLMVVDNCEHLRAGVARAIQSLLMACPYLCVLATSREPLRVPGEHVWRLDPLAVPAADSTELVSTLADLDSVALVMKRATSANPRLVWSDDNIRAAANIARQLDGIPLALELAAARAGHLALPQLSVRLADRFRLLSVDDSDRPAHHKTLRAAVDWSYDLLNDQERTLLRRLSVFAGAFRLESAEAVCADSDLPEEDVLDRLAGLIDKSLVTFSDDDGDPAYSLLATIREYATLRLAEAGEQQLLLDRHVDHLLRLVHDFPHTASYHPDAEQRKVLAFCLPDLRSAIDHALTRSDPTTAMELCLRICRYGFSRGVEGEALVLAERALASPGGDDETRGWLEFHAGLHAANLCDFARAALHSDRCAEIARAGTNVHLLASSYLLAADVCEDRGDHVGARALIEAALAISDVDRQTAVLQRALGALLVRAGDVRGAAEAFREARDRFEALGAGYEHLRSLSAQAWMLAWLHDPEAVDLLQEAHRQAVEIGNVRVRGMAMSGLAVVAEQQGRFELAQTCVGAAEGLAAEGGFGLAACMSDIPQLTPLQDELLTRLAACCDDESARVARERGRSAGSESVLAEAVAQLAAMETSR
ncbi:MAG TPA: adenylate/guanylate cyclase domain-containing protein [Mycobacteriales bacterium]|nr:adenylate/guanylate cyclase domain-containing protein [Mycobacteriales bacterium]